MRNKFGRRSGGVLLDCLSLRNLYPLTVGYKISILPRKFKDKNKSLESTECRWQLLLWECIPIWDKELDFPGPSSGNLAYLLGIIPQCPLKSSTPLWSYCNSWIFPARQCCSTCRPFRGLSFLGKPPSPYSCFRPDEALNCLLLRLMY